MSDDRKFSKEVEVKEPRPMKQVEAQDANRLSNAYDPAKSGQQPQQPERVDSRQVGNSVPGMNGPNPPQNAKNAMAADTHNKQMSQDDARVKAAADRNAKVAAERQAAGHEQQAKQKQAGKETEQKRASVEPQNSKSDKAAKGFEQNAKTDQAAAQQKTKEAKALERNEGVKVAKENADRVQSKDDKQR